jgi:hypothetical protein
LRLLDVLNMIPRPRLSQYEMYNPILLDFHLYAWPSFAVLFLS